ncbi:hypothetical protein BAUCODRAFT_517973 [Baudoinia panamericana UAMH 10762]|uniref:Uncharacterized protein n=1 Tax=Baudoinia panamericana (strain UAMH 10762) TaxID=717646 RepID=M2NB76_BAUPA|nr:uncharacterized protein BAUCODRAFT_517973 [Baudoinia panamericana UAMH 10762]EMC96110.1 hypothetical protein BAUCODRAFT_517973 [Baudoinia panamericana UAMH 10762]
MELWQKYRTENVARAKCTARNPRQTERRMLHASLHTEATRRSPRNHTTSHHVVGPPSDFGAVSLITAATTAFEQGIASAAESSWTDFTAGNSETGGEAALAIDKDTEGEDGTEVHTSDGAGTSSQAGEHPIELSTAPTYNPFQFSASPAIYAVKSACESFRRSPDHWAAEPCDGQPPAITSTPPSTHREPQAYSRLGGREQKAEMQCRARPYKRKPPPDEICFIPKRSTPKRKEPARFASCTEETPSGWTFVDYSVPEPSIREDESAEAKSYPGHRRKGEDKAVRYSVCPSGSHGYR